jgi:nicotinate-nucleotide adenylyltransferase
MSEERIGILGGTFDPVHNAHVALAAKALTGLDLARVYLVVSDAPPHKPKKERTSGYHRFAMVSLGVQRHPRLLPSPLELEHPGDSYTIHTLDRFIRSHRLNGDQLVFLAGGDSLRDFHHWRQWEELLRRYQFVFAVRQGVELGEHARRLLAGERLRDARHAGGDEWPALLRRERSALLLDMELADISSTRLREMLRSEKDCADFIPDAVLRYIHKTNLYGGK